MADQQSRPPRRRSVKIHRTYREPDSETDLEYDTLRTRSQPTRSSQRIQNYREGTDSALSSSVESDDVENVQSKSSIPLRPGRTRKNPRRSLRTRGGNSTHGPPPIPSGFGSFKRRKLSQSGRVGGKEHKILQDDVDLTPVNTDAPPWQTLEYHILLKIFQYASYPLQENALQSGASIEWLLRLSTLSKSFHDAATAALLWEPPLQPRFRAQGLLSLLSQDQCSLAAKYRNKVHSLNIEVKTLFSKNGLVLEDLLRFTPLLSYLRIHHWHDEMVGKAIWAEPIVSHHKWAYGNLFEQLDQNSIRLKSFEWNGRFRDTLDVMQTAHSRQCMQALEDISVVNFNYGEEAKSERLRARDIFVAALTPLSYLQHIEFRNCTILDVNTMTQLPPMLRSLKIVNCLSLTSDAIVSYLTSAGSQLLSLNLEGNQVMDLAFMPNLAQTCPHLETLHINLSYEDCSSYHDRNPLYDDLLPNGSPSWPSSLSSISVGPLRSLSVEDAEGFYKSLIDSADNLPHLRYLSIKTFLTNANWRDRARLRTQWRPLFEKVFAANKTYVPTLSEPKQQISSSSKRRSVRLQVQEDLSITEEFEEDSDTDPSSNPGIPRQNRCELVEFEISDQRPTQEQFHEGDFLDSEPSDDGEWTGSSRSAANS